MKYPYYKMILVLCSVVLTGITGAASFATQANAASMSGVSQPVISDQSITPGTQTIKPLQQPLVVNLSAIPTMCTFIPQTVNSIIESINFMDQGLKCECHFPKYTIESFKTHVEGCCSPQKSFSVAEQKLYGCTDNDTLKQCMDKLIGRCIRSYGWVGWSPPNKTIQSYLDDLEKKSNDISNKTKELSEQVKKLRSMLQ